MTYHIRDAHYEDAPALAECVIEPMVTTFRGLVPDQCLAWLTKDESCANWQAWFRRESGDGQCLFVAELSSHQVVGCALAGPQTADPTFQGELYLLGVLSEYQGLGIGRQLVRSVAARLLERDIESMRVCALSVNPYRGFYERLGGHYVSEHPYDWNGVTLSEVVYGWTDITRLLE